MEDGGFTVVTTGSSVMQSKKAKVADGNHTTMLGISQEEAERIYREQVKKGMSVIGLTDEEAKKERVRILKEEDADHLQNSEAFAGINLKGLVPERRYRKDNSLYSF